MSKKGQNSEVVFYGTEPEWNNIPENQIDIECQLAKAMNWYNYMSSDSEKRKWISEYCKNNAYSKEQTQSILNNLNEKSTRIYDIPELYGFDLGIYCRLSNNGAPLSINQKEKIKKVMEMLLLKNKNSSNKSISSVYQKTEDKSSEIVNYFMSLGDELIIGNDPFNKKSNIEAGSILKIAKDSIKSLSNKNSKKSKIIIEEDKQPITVKELLIRKNIKPKHCNKLITAISEEINQYKNDIQVEKDQYIIYKKENIEKWLNFNKNILTECENISKEIKNNTIVIKRKRKPKSPIDLVKKLKYKKEDTTYKISSILPSKIIGSSKILLFNTKYRVATLLESNSKDGLSIKGSKVINVDETCSISKKIRKPESFITSVSGKGIRIVQSAMNSIKGKSGKIKTKINEDTIIIGAY